MWICEFWAFLRVYISILERDLMETLFLFQVSMLKRTFSIQKKNVIWAPCHITSKKMHPQKKIWTLVNYISWCLRDYMIIWTKFVNDNGGLSEYLPLVMWSFGHLCIFGCKTVRILCFLWFWGMVFSGANKITGSVKFPMYFGLNFYCNVVGPLWKLRTFCYYFIISFIVW